MQKMFVANVSTDHPDFRVGIKIPDTVKEEDASGFAQGIECALKVLDKIPREQQRLISDLEKENILEII